jgi:hypothetical protein
MAPKSCCPVLINHHLSTNPSNKEFPSTVFVTGLQDARTCSLGVSHFSLPYIQGRALGFGHPVSRMVTPATRQGFLCSGKQFE